MEALDSIYRRLRRDMDYLLTFTELLSITLKCQDDPASDKVLLLRPDRVYIKAIYQRMMREDCELVYGNNADDSANAWSSGQRINSKLCVNEEAPMTNVVTSYRIIFLFTDLVNVS